MLVCWKSHSPNQVFNQQSHPFFHCIDLCTRTLNQTTPVCMRMWSHTHCHMPTTYIHESCTYCFNINNNYLWRSMHISQHIFALQFIIIIFFFLFHAKLSKTIRICKWKCKFFGNDTLFVVVFCTHLLLTENVHTYKQAFISKLYLYFSLSLSLSSHFVQFVLTHTAICANCGVFQWLTAEQQRRRRRLRSRRQPLTALLRIRRVCQLRVVATTDGARWVTNDKAKVRCERQYKLAAN